MGRATLPHDSMKNGKGGNSSRAPLCQTKTYENGNAMQIVAVVSLGSLMCIPGSVEEKSRTPKLHEQNLHGEKPVALSTLCTPLAAWTLKGKDLFLLCWRDPLKE